MKKWKVYGTGLVTLASLCRDASAQVPAVPAAPAPLAPVAAAPAPATIFSFLGLTKDQKEAMKRKCCQTPFGQLIGGMLAPARMLSGGVVGNFCPTTPSPADLAKPGPEGAAAKIQADEAGAKARRAAIRYLGTVDCHYWPEVQDQLIGALRGDRNECVRWEAAMALGGGCCCTKKTIQALLISATGSNKDEFPPETCERVREAAMASLQHCLACFSQEVAPEPPKPEKPESVRPAEKPRVQAAGSVQLTAFYMNLENKSLAQCVQETRLALTENAGTFSQTAPLPTGTRSMSNIIANAMGDRPVRQRLRNVAATLRPTGMENGTSQPEPIPMSSFSVTPVPETKTVETKPVAPPKTLGATVADAIAKRKPQVTTPATPEVAPAVAKPQSTPVPVAPSTPPRLLAPDSQPAPMMQKQSRAPFSNTSSVMVRMDATMPATRAPLQTADPEPYLSVLKRSIYPFQREWAVESLAGADWQSHPEVLQAVLMTARKDAAPTVRAACVRVLARKHATSPDAVAIVQEMRADPDPRVVHEASIALSQLEGTPQSSTVQSASLMASSPARPFGEIQPTSYSVPSQPSTGVFGRQ